ncbi:MAG: PadR family transcriptional regulator [Acholeplasmataceae bacterium]|nr:PadR family transcriptional regulator [Acholeplasmataceae bacterium]
MVIIGDLIRGHTEAIILSILEREDSYGYKINQTIEEISQGELLLTEATMYSVFKRLEKNEYIQFYWQKGINKVNRKYYSITALGRLYLNEHKHSWHKLSKILNEFLK